MIEGVNGAEYESWDGIMEEHHGWVFATNLWVTIPMRGTIATALDHIGSDWLLCGTRQIPCQDTLHTDKWCSLKNGLHTSLMYITWAGTVFWGFLVLKVFKGIYWIPLMWNLFYFFLVHFYCSELQIFFSQSMKYWIFHGLAGAEFWVIIICSLEK